MEIKVGQIWQVVTDDFWVLKTTYYLNRENIGNGRDIKINLTRDEYIEIRYPTEWHFRTIDGIYPCAEPKEILKHCRYIGEIAENIRFKNNHKLHEILEEKLYKAVWD